MNVSRGRKRIRLALEYRMSQLLTEKEERLAQLEGEKREGELLKKLQTGKEMKKLELEAEKEERAEAISLKELELQEWQVEVGQRSGPNENKSEMGNIKLRLPFFAESKDDVDAYLKRFDRLAQLQNLGYPAGYSFRWERR